MTTVSSLTGSSSSSTTATATSTAETSYNTFLTLLTTQLQHQDPLNPTATDTFTSQMIQLSTVEQQLKTNEMLESIMSDLSSISAANGLGYVGKTVTAAGATTLLQDGSCTWRYALASDAYSTTLQVLDSSGNVVYEENGSLTTGTHDFKWDGTTSDGETAPEGNYTLQVVSYDASGNTITTGTQIVAKITGVDNTSGSTVLKVGSLYISLDDVVNVSVS